MMIDVEDNRDYGDETTIVADIDHLDFNVLCDRCNHYGGSGRAEVNVRVNAPGCVKHDTRWTMCIPCSTRRGPCNCCSAEGFYEVLS